MCDFDTNDHVLSFNTSVSLSLQTDLCGIKWRSYRIEHELAPDPLEDPVISSFTKCLSSDILSVWRRVQHAKSPPAPPPPPSLEPGAPPPPPPPPAAPPTVTTYKELWIFWYGDEPELSNIIVPQLFNRSEYGGACRRRPVVPPVVMPPISQSASSNGGLATGAAERAARP